MVDVLRTVDDRGAFLGAGAAVFENCDRGDFVAHFWFPREDFEGGEVSDGGSRWVMEVASRCGWWLPKLTSRSIVGWKEWQEGIDVLKKEDVEMRSWDAIRVHKFSVLKVNVF